MYAPAIMLCLFRRQNTNTFQDRTKRVKDARSEAQKEIDEYKSSKDKEFKQFEDKVGLLHPGRHDIEG